MAQDPTTVGLLRLGNRHRVTEPIWREVSAVIDEHDVSVLEVDDETIEQLRREAETGSAERPQLLARTLDCLARERLVISADPDSALAWVVGLYAGAGQGRAPRWVAGADLFLSKRSTREHCARRGVAVPLGRGGGEGRSAQEVWGRFRRETESEWAVVKDARSWSGRGVRRVPVSAPDDSHLLDFVAHRDFVVEEWVAGMEVSVEAVIVASSVVVVGWTVKGRTEDSAHPLQRLRISPALPVPPPLVAAVVSLLQDSGHQGIAEIEFVVPSCGPALVLEVNPRVSWSSPLIWTARGVSSIEVALRAVSGAEARCPAPRWSAEWAVTDGHPGQDAWLYRGEHDYPDHLFVRGDTADDLVRAVTRHDGGAEPTVSGLVEWVEGGGGSDG